MCTPWNDQQWLDNSKPSVSESEYTLIDTRYNHEGTAARTYRDTDGWYFAVLPGVGNRAVYSDSDAADYGTTAQAAALAYLNRNGFTEAEPLALEGKPMTIAEVIGDAPATT